MSIARELAFLVLTVSLCAQDSRPATTADKKPVVVILGASVSAGFSCSMMGIGEAEKNQTMTLKRALEPVFPRERFDVRDLATSAMFLNPSEHGGKQSKLALRAKPDVVIGIDFLFWFGYGHVRGSAGAANIGKGRLALQQQAFELLAPLTCPILLGDYPDMTGAHPRMLSPAQIPDAEQRKALNAALAAWAKEHPNVRVFPLGKFVEESKSKGLTVEHDQHCIELPAAFLLQEDQLHATRLGMAFLVHLLAPELRAMLAEPSPLRPRAYTFGELVDAHELKGELPAPVKRAEPAGVGGDGKMK